MATSTTFSSNRNTADKVSRALCYRNAIFPGAALACMLEQGAADDESLAALIDLGMHHEQQHQELMLTDLKIVL